MTTAPPAENLARMQDLSACLDEMGAITKKSKLYPQDRLRFQFLNTRVSALKAGFSPTEVRQHELNQIEAENDLPLTYFPKRTLTPEVVAEIRAFQQFHKTGEVEKRIGQVGNLGAQLAALATFGVFVPIQFLARINAAVKAFDPIFSPELVSYYETQAGGLLRTPISSDLGNDASPVVESGQATDSDLTKVRHAITVPKAYKTPFWKLSIEAVEDIESWLPILDAAEYFFSMRIARGIGRDLLLGNGANGRIVGLLQQLILAGASPVIASGSAENTGGTETGSNSVGTRDLVRVYLSVDQAYRQSSRMAWLMNDTTLTYIMGLLDKQGRPIVTMSEGYPTLFRKPVLISPSLDSIGPSKTPILVGDFSRFLVHCAKNGNYVKRFDQAPGYAEAGVVGYAMFARYDGALLWDSVETQKPPIARLQNAS